MIMKRSARAGHPEGRENCGPRSAERISMIKRGIFSLGFATLSLDLSAAAAAESWPARPVNLVVPQPPGGPTDIFARLIAQRMSAALGQPVIVDNRAGGALMIGTKAVIVATPDGYTL